MAYEEDTIAREVHREIITDEGVLNYGAYATFRPFPIKGLRGLEN